jgi:hypothetical protein
MTTGAQVLSFLIPNGGWVISGDDYEGIEFIEAKPITKKEFEDGFEAYEAAKAEEATNAALKAEAKAGLLARLGITAEEAEFLLS